MKILITGAAGFIGFHLAKRLLSEGHEILGVDDFDDYYDVRLKEARNAVLEKDPHFKVVRADISDKTVLKPAFIQFAPDVVVNLAAQAGVRYSIEHPDVYAHTNITGFLNVLECCRHASKMPALLYASSSSVYGGLKEMPFREDMRVDTPISLYAASKKSNELMAHCYSHLYGMQTIGFRFFSVYGPWGRPDMAAWLFAEAMKDGRSIKVFNYGDMKRDFTYIDDIVDGVVRCIYGIRSLPLCDVYNIGNHRPERLLDMIEIIAREMGFASLEDVKMEMLPMQDGDIPASFASIDKLRNAVGYEPTTPISVGMPKFIAWYRKWVGKD
jgi:Nucleoside-diphosphate-sugar epimerases